MWRKRKLAAQTTVETTLPYPPLSQKPITTTTNNAVTPHPHPQQQTRQKPPAHHLPWLSSSANQQQQQLAAPFVTTSAVYNEQIIPTLPTYAEDGIFGRYGGGTGYGTHYRGFAGKRDVSLATGGLREEWGVDLGDVPAARLPNLTGSS